MNTARLIIDSNKNKQLTQAVPYSPRYINLIVVVEQLKADSLGHLRLRSSSMVKNNNMIEHRVIVFVKGLAKVMAKVMVKDSAKVMVKDSGRG